MGEIGIKIVVAVLKFYKKYISRDEVCRFIPSCSEYMMEAVRTKGVARGLYLGVKRLVRCRPGGGSGVDLVE